MQRIPDVPPRILPLPDHTERKKWSVMIPAFNCSRFLPEAIESVLQQDLGEELMQIEVIDDKSTDTDVEALVKKVGKGRIAYFCQPENRGSLRNFETCINRAKGKYIHLLHGDDCIKPGFYKGFDLLFEQYPEAGAAFCGYEYIDAESKLIRPFIWREKNRGVVDDCLGKLALQQLMQYVAVVVKREVFEDLGSFYGVTYGEDWEMWARIAKKHPVAYLPATLAQYREHRNSISGNSYLSGKNINDIKKVFKTINSYLPVNQQQKMLRLAHKNYAHWAIGIARDLLKNQHDKKLIFIYLKQVLKFHADFTVIKAVIKVLVLMQIKAVFKTKGHLVKI